MTFKLDLRLRQGAKLLNNFDLLTKIGDGDMVAMEKKYHNHCLCAEIQMENDNDSVFYGTVLSEVINHIKKTTSSGSQPIFFLAQLRELFDKTYQRYTNKVYSVHHTRFKNDFLKYMSSLKTLKKENISCLLPKIQQWTRFSKIWKGTERMMSCIYLKQQRL